MRNIFDRKRVKFLQLCCLCAAVFVIGYVVGMLQSSAKCSDGKKDTRIMETPPRPRHATYLVVVIFSAPQNHDQRQVVRRTWLSTKNALSIMHLFAVGSVALDSKQASDLHRENSEYSDMLILDTFSDSFSKLSEKLREVLKWVDANVSYAFLLKVDDDSFVRLDVLYRRLLQQPKERFYWGFFDGQARVKSKGKWLEQTWFLCDRYLPYAKGGGYVVSSDLVEKLVGIADYLSLYKNEDVSLGTWLSPLDIKRVHDPSFDTEYVPRGCSNSYIVTHKQSTAMMVSKYENLQLMGKMCVSEVKTRNSYIYNWNVLPSQCCIRNDSRIP